MIALPGIRFEDIPLTVVFLVTMAVTVASIWAGRLIGRRSRARSTASEEDKVGTVVGAVGGLLAFFLVFTFGITASRFDTRKGLLLDEASALGTAYMRADLLQEPHRAEVRRLLREYVEIRTRDLGDRGELAKAIARSEAIHDELWSHAILMAQADRSSEIDALSISALNEVIELHTKRVTVALHYRIPTTIWVVLFLLTVLAMGSLGYEFGLSGSGRFAITIVLGMTLSLVILLIADLDRSGAGLVRVSQQPMEALLGRMRAGSG